MMGFTVLLRINIVASLLLITTPLLALSAQHFSASYYLADGNGYEELPVQKSSSSQKIELACQASQYPDFCKSSLQSNGHISENAGAEEIIVAAIVLSQQATEQSYITSSQLLSKSSDANLTNVATDCLVFLTTAIEKTEKSRNVELKSGNIKNVKAWISAALTNQYECFSALKYVVNITQDVGSAMQELITVLNKTSTALSMVDALDTYGENTVIWRPPKTERSSSNSFSTADYSHYYNKIWDSLILEELVPNITVSNDGPTRSIQDAVDRAPLNSDRRFVIRIKAGVYNEIVRIHTNKTNLMFVGDGMDRTVITGSMFVPSLPGIPTTYDSATVAVDGDGFLARDIAFENAAGPVTHQAVALRVSSDRSAFYNCAFLGNQDTLYAHTLRQYYRNCRIEGNVDFIFGNSAAIFENCQILVRPRQQNVSNGASDSVTAQGRIDPGQPTGFVFHNCAINGTDEYIKYYSANPKIYKAYLGRPWKSYSRVIFMNSYLGEIIEAEGWMPWIGNFSLDTLYYGEYKNYGPGATVSGRVPWSSQVPDTNRILYSIKSFIQGDEWLPIQLH